jgi:hypothetical protein
MRPVRFVALSEDGQSFVLADEVGRLLTLPIDDRVAVALRSDRPAAALAPVAGTATLDHQALSPRDIQARIRAGASADDVARITGVPVDRVLRYAGPVLQERAMLAQHARRTRLKSSDRGLTLAEVVDPRLTQHGVDSDKISWDAYRRDDGVWRIVATWPSGKAVATATWELDKARQVVAAFDDMAVYLCTDRQSPIVGQEPPAERGGHGLAAPSRGESSRGDLGRGADAPKRTRGLGAPAPSDPIRSGRDSLLASLERPLSASARATEPAMLAPRPSASSRSAFDDDPDRPIETPAVPSLAVLRPRRSPAPVDDDDKPRKRLPSWDDVLFGPAQK